MKRHVCIIALLASVLAYSCRRDRGSDTPQAIPVQQAVDQFRLGTGNGYRCPIGTPTKGLLTIRRSGHADVVLEQDYSPGEDALFGYNYVTFKTRAGVEEHKFCAQLRYIRKHEDGNGEESGGRQHEFFLDAPISGGSGHMRDPLSLEQDLEFKTLRCGHDEDAITLSIRFERIPKKSAGGDA